MQGQREALERFSFLGRAGNTPCFKHAMKKVLFNPAQVPLMVQTVQTLSLLMGFSVGESFAGV